ncbi:ABC transporter substrate-binding protein [Capillimicrobium parvum]|uniref:High-affinity heme uptake system protein IsdE n=1 Tax=Capillimicrobium parvum TaxID=2884022 RepID=A0A9E7C1Z7_9ACTN|nr:ABC transporter substrate-binding protein [Capillimicrobium parvum]UGS37921.1 High-affinity heme uptake system protein IsdE [Capillimicrobium parvum]
MTAARSLLLVFAAALVVSLAASAPAPAASKRIVALTPFTANVLAELGVRPIAVGDPGASAAQLSGRLNGVRRLKLSHPNGPNLEQLAALRPDIVFSSPTWRPGTPRIQRLGIKVHDGFDPQRLGTVPLGIRYIAGAVGRGRAGRDLTNRVQAAYRAASAKPRSHPRVLLVMGLARSTMALLGQSWGGDIIRAAGGRLVTEGIKPIGSRGEDALVGNLSNEAVVRMNPDVIIVVPHGNAQDIGAIARFYRSYRPWRTTKAARRGRIHVPTDDSLLQANLNPAALIRHVRQAYLHN